MSMIFPKKSVMTNFVSRLMLAALLSLQLSFRADGRVCAEQRPEAGRAEAASDGRPARSGTAPDRRNRRNWPPDLTGPAANPECVWLGRRVISLLWRDDLDTAFRHLDLYDRFGCPGGQIQATFRCVVRLGEIDPKATDALKAPTR